VEVHATAVHQLARLEWLRCPVVAESGAVSAAGDTLTKTGQRADDRALRLETRLVRRLYRGHD
jgi:hypothetical protein